MVLLCGAQDPSFNIHMATRWHCRQGLNLWSLSLHGKFLSFSVLSLSPFPLTCSLLCYFFLYTVAEQNRSLQMWRAIWSLDRYFMRIISRDTWPFEQRNEHTGMTYAISLLFNDSVNFVFWSLRSVSEFGIRAWKINIGKYYLCYLSFRLLNISSSFETPF